MRSETEGGMTDPAKALLFATACLKWPDVVISEHGPRTLICDGTEGSLLSFDLDSADDLQAVLQEFLGNRYLIQINRGTGTLFHWRVIVGLQDLSIKGVCTDHAVGVGEDLWDAVFDACVQAAGMFSEQKP
jgi:hypothetical protein